MTTSRLRRCSALASEMKGKVSPNDPTHITMYRGPAGNVVGASLRGPTAGTRASRAKTPVVAATSCGSAFTTLAPQAARASELECFNDGNFRGSACQWLRPELACRKSQMQDVLLRYALRLSMTRWIRYRG